MAGNGLGLATVREIVREHGGTMNVRSTPGVGSCFEVWLPCIPTRASRPEEGFPPLPFGRGETVLLIDGEREQLLKAEELLAALGYEPVGFARREDALAACEEAPKRFDAVVSHLVPATSTLELAAALHSRAPDLPVLLATESADGISTELLVAAGVVDVVHWPIIANQMAAALERCAPMRRFEGRRVGSAASESTHVAVLPKQLTLCESGKALIGIFK
jgi:FixJ family two-component response regulator